MYAFRYQLDERSFQVPLSHPDRVDVIWSTLISIWRLLRSKSGSSHLDPTIPLLSNWRILTKLSLPYLPNSSFSSLFICALFSLRLRQVDVKAEHFERQVQRAEQERDQWERKYEEAQEKYQESKRELDEVVSQMESL